jgi:hypothetical protein
MEFLESGIDSLAELIQFRSAGSLDKRLDNARRRDVDVDVILSHGSPVHRLAIELRKTFIKDYVPTKIHPQPQVSRRLEAESQLHTTRRASTASAEFDKRTSTRPATG